MGNWFRWGKFNLAILSHSGRAVPDNCWNKSQEWTLPDTSHELHPAMATRVSLILLLPLSSSFHLLDALASLFLFVTRLPSSRPQLRLTTDPEWRSNNRMYHITPAMSRCAQHPYSPSLAVMHLVRLGRWWRGELGVKLVKILIVHSG